MKFDIHLLDVADPSHVKEGMDLMANCGQPIRRAVFALRFESEPGDITETIRICRRCMATQTKQRWVYGVISGEYVRVSE